MEKYLEELKEIWMEKLVFLKLKLILHIYSATQTPPRPVFKNFNSPLFIQNKKQHASI